MTFALIKYKKPVPRPVVGFAWATDFNQTVGMDLKELGPSLWFLHIIDEFTRFSNAAIIRSKTAVIKKFLQCWISLFGAPQKVISDNGGEFDSNEFRNLCENFNITVKTTPAYSPWSNGLFRFRQSFDDRPYFSEPLLVPFCTSLNTDISGTRKDIKKQSTVFFPVFPAISYQSMKIFISYPL